MCAVTNLHRCQTTAIIFKSYIKIGHNYPNMIKSNVPDMWNLSIKRHCVSFKKILNRFSGAFFVGKPIPRHNTSVYNSRCYATMTGITTVTALREGLCYLGTRSYLLSSSAGMVLTPSLIWYTYFWKNVQIEKPLTRTSVK